MKTLYLILFLLSFAAFGQSDSTFSESGQLIRIDPTDLLTARKSVAKGWYENGQLWYVIRYKHGKMVKQRTYYESGENGMIEKNRKYRTKMKGWSANKQLIYQSKNCYRKSVFKSYDTSGILLSYTVQKKGAILSCAQIYEDDPAVKDSISKVLGNCQCPWGKVYLKNGITVDEKGRDLRTYYTSVSTSYYPNGKKRKELVWAQGTTEYLISEWDEEGNITRTDVYIPGQ